MLTLEQYKEFALDVGRTVHRLKQGSVGVNVQDTDDVVQIMFESQNPAQRGQYEKLEVLLGSDNPYKEEGLFYRRSVSGSGKTGDDSGEDTVLFLPVNADTAQVETFMDQCLKSVAEAAGLDVEPLASTKHSLIPPANREGVGAETDQPAANSAEITYLPVAESREP